jgi:hypothetical protein
MIKINVRANIQAASRDLNAFAYRQLPFATALALTGIAKKIRLEEQKALPTILDRPTPFTINSIGVKAATKANPTATVFVRDIAAQYLAPFEFGGPHFLGAKRGLLTPKNVGLNPYGNLPRNLVARLKGRRDVFVGAVTTRSGETIRGLWQRPSTGATGLKLLIRFSDPLPVKQHLDYRARAEAVARRWFEPEFRAAMKKALATAR